MPIFTVDANNRLVVHNGIAYGYIAGGATSFIDRDMGWFTGDNLTKYVAMLLSRGRLLVEIIGVMAIRAAIVEAVANHPGELGPMVQAGQLQLLASERLTNDDLPDLIQWARLNPVEWNVAHAAAIAGNAAAVPPPAPYAIDRLPDRVIRDFKAPEWEDWAKACARLAYSILAVNGVGLIMSSHHLRGNAVNLARNITKLYEIDKVLADRGWTLTEFIRRIFHDALHPISYDRVANWVMAIPAGAAAKIAAPIGKRLPVYPGGVVFVRNTITVLVAIGEARVLGLLHAQIKDSVKEAALYELDIDIKQNVLDYSEQFRPDAAAGKKADINNVVLFAVWLMGIYDQWRGLVNVDTQDGPTKGPGMKRMIQEHIAAYMDGVDVAKKYIEEAKAAVVDYAKEVQRYVE